MAMLTVVVTFTALEVTKTLFLLVLLPVMVVVSATSDTLEMLTKNGSILRARAMVEMRRFEARASLVNWAGDIKPEM